MPRPTARMPRTPRILALVIALLVPTVARAQPDTVAADFTLKDQFGRPHAVRFADAPLTLVVFSGRTSAGQGSAWLRQGGQALRAAESGLRAIEIAAVGDVPRPVRPVVLGVFRRQPAIPLDWGDTVAERFGYRSGHARIVLVDSDGRIRATASGAPTPESIDGFVAAARGAGAS